MKVLIVGRSYPLTHIGMLGTFEYDQGLVLKQLGCDVRYFFCDTRSIIRLHKIGSYSYRDSVPSSGVYLPIGRFPEPLFSDDFKPDIVHIHYPAIVLTKGIWRYIREKCDHVVITEHYSKVMTGQLSDESLKELSKQYRQSDAVICVSEKLKNAVQRLCPDKRVDVIPNVISKEMTPISKTKRDFTRFVYVGKIDDVKQVDILVRAFSQVCTMDEHCRLVIVGNGHRQRSVKRLVRDLNIQDRVTFYGNVPRKRVGEILNGCDFFVTATRLETFCVPIIEAWYCGLPVIIPDSIPILNYANEGNSLIFKDSDVKDMARAMGEAMRRTDGFDPAVISKTAAGIFGGESVGRQLMAIYQGLL